MARDEQKAAFSVETIDEIAMLQKDTIELAKVGKKQVLKRRFGLVSMIGFSSSLLITWEGTITNFIFGLPNGGPAGVIYGFLICWIGTLSVFAAMGELASMLPSSGGQYHWVSILAPESYRLFLSYLTGWITVVAWITVPAGGAAFYGQILQGLLVTNFPNYVPKGWQGTLMMYAFLLVCMVFNTWLGAVLPTVEVLVLILNILVYFAILIPLVTLSDHGNASTLFTSFWNLGGWPTEGLAFFIGLVGNATAFLGADGAIHMAEEVAGSSVNVPRSMMWSITINGIMGFGMLMAFLLSSGNLEEIMESGSSFPYMDILAKGLGSQTGANVLIGLLLVLSLCSGIAGLTSASRMMWSFARERAIPGWKWLRQIDRYTSIPVHTTLVVVVASALLGLINIGSTMILQAVLSLLLEAFFSSYLISLVLLLYRRLRGDIQEARIETDITVVNKTASGETFFWGPWRLPGGFGIANNVVALIYVLTIMFFGVWPPTAHVDAITMNYAIVVLGGVAIGVMFYYFGWARKHYAGPVFEVDLMKL